VNDDSGDSDSGDSDCGGSGDVHASSKCPKRSSPSCHRLSFSESYLCKKAYKSTGVKRILPLVSFVRSVSQFAKCSTGRTIQIANHDPSKAIIPGSVSGNLLPVVNVVSPSTSSNVVNKPVNVFPEKVA
jgi:hypothetical protein